jgi:hypothetical protein
VMTALRCMLPVGAKRSDEDIGIKAGHEAGTCTGSGSRPSKTSGLRTHSGQHSATRCDG